MKKHILRYFPLAVLLLAVAAIFVTGLHHHFSFKSLREDHDTLKAFALNHPFITPLIFMGIFIASVFLILPNALFLCLVAGFLFPRPLAMLYSCIGETLGATIFFLVVYYAFRDDIAHKESPKWKKIEKKLKENAPSYLLFLRISHLIPYWMIAAASACFGVRLWTFVWTAFLGFLPLAFVFVTAGSGLDMLFKTQAKITMRGIFNPEVKIALIVLGVLSLAPIFLKRWKKHAK